MRHWLRQSDWLPTLEATLALDEESVRRVGDDKVGGPEVSRQLRLIRILMRDLLIGVCFFFFFFFLSFKLKNAGVFSLAMEEYQILYAFLSKFYFR